MTERRSDRGLAKWSSRVLSRLRLCCDGGRVAVRTTAGVPRVVEVAGNPVAIPQTGIVALGTASHADLELQRGRRATQLA